MKRLASMAFGLAVSLCSTACQTPLERAGVPMPEEGWSRVFQKDHGKGVGTIIEALPPGESLEAWTQMLTIQSLESLQGREALEVAEELLAEQKAKYGDVEQHILGEDEFSVVYEWLLQGHPEHPDQHELARLIEGNDAIHRVAYVRKGPRMELAERARWLEALRGTKLFFKGELVER